MSAARLREAAALLRERAGAATNGRWAHCYTASNRHWVEGPGDYDGYDDTLATGTAPADATYIATMSPPVALALADWLTKYGDLIDAARHIDRPAFGDLAHALTLADAILGSAS